MQNFWVLPIFSALIATFSAFAQPPQTETSPSVAQTAKPTVAPGVKYSKYRKTVESALPQKWLKDLNVGIAVASVQTGEVLYEYKPDQLLIPASVNKVITSYAALKRLKGNFTFKTTVATTGSIRDGRLAGDLYLRGGGDPSLVSERLWMLVNELVRSGIRSITGNIVADSSYFDLERTPESRPKYLKDQAYNAPIGALSFNFNTTTIYVKPGDFGSQAPKVYTDPENSYIDVVNQATTGGPGSSNTVHVQRTSYVKGDIGDTVLLRGSIPLDQRELRFYRNIVNPGLYTAHMFKTFWEQRGMKQDGNVIEGTVPEKARTILDFESQPLWHVIWGMNKFSNNFVADQVVKKLGAEVYGPPGTIQKGISAIEEALSEIGIAKKSYTVLDGSGLTRGTKVTARQILKVLMAASTDFSISAEFLASLGIAGEDGTLRSRFSKSSLASSLRGKTGTLDGVSSLAGFAPSEDGEQLAFVIIFNDPKQRVGRMTALVDQVAVAISRFSRRS